MTDTHTPDTITHGAATYRRDAYTLSAADLRQAVTLGTQPALCVDDEATILANPTHAALHLFYACGVTVRRFNTAADAVSLHRNLRSQILLAAEQLDLI